MRVIIVGIGDIGYELTRDLTRSGSKTWAYEPPVKRWA